MYLSLYSLHRSLLFSGDEGVDFGASWYTEYYRKETIWAEVRKDES